MPNQKIAIGAIATTRLWTWLRSGSKHSISPDQVIPRSTVLRTKTCLLLRKRGTFELGTTTAYYDRVSLFRLEFRKGDGEWQSTKTVGCLPSRQQPTAALQLNAVLLPEKDFYEFRFIPFCGNSSPLRAETVVKLNTSGKSTSTSKKFICSTTTKAGTSWTPSGIRLQSRAGRKLDEVFTVSHPHWATGEGVRQPNQPRFSA